jgi:hypothetical protein
MAYPSTSEEIEARLAALAGKFKETTERQKLPNRTNEAPPGPGPSTGRTVTFLRIGTGTGDGRPRVVLVAGMHAREWAPPDALMTFVEKLLQAHATTSAMVYPAVTDARKAPTLTYNELSIPFTDVKSIVEGLELYVLPLVNPDGRAFSMTPGHRGWRKNRRPAPVGKSCPALPSGLSAATRELVTNDPTGVDLNRNFDIGWDIKTFYSTAGEAGVQVSADACDIGQTFHGPSAASEPETKNVQRLILDKKPGFYMDIHAAGRKIEFPWGLEGNQTAEPKQTFRSRDFDRKSDGTGGRDGRSGSAYNEWIPPGVEAAHLALAQKMADGILASTGFTAAQAAADPVAAEVRKRSTYDPIQSSKVAMIPGASDDFAFSQSIGSTPGPPVTAVAKDPVFVYTLEIGHDDENLFWPAKAVEYPKIEREVAAALLEFLKFAVSKRVVSPPVPKPPAKVRKHTTNAIEIGTTGILLAGTGEHQVHVLGALSQVPAPLPPTLKESFEPVGDESTRDEYLSGELRGSQEDPDAQPFNPQLPAFFQTAAGEALFLERDWSGIELASLTIPHIPDVAPSNGGGGGGGGGGGTSALPVPLFRPAVADPLQPSAAFQTALDAAVAPLEKRLKVAKGGLAVRFAFAEVTDPANPFPFAGYGADQMDYIASEAKVEVMYAAFALRDMAQRFADATGATSLTDLVSKLTAQMGPAIRAAVPEIASATNITDTQRDPGYMSKGDKLDIDMLTATATAAAAGGLDIGFTPTFRNALDGMIVPSNNQSAGSCVHAVGYGYMNGALAAGGFFDRTATPAPGIGLWEAGDYQQGTVWPFVSIPTPGNDLGAQLGTARQMVRLVSLVFTKRLLTTALCDEMLALLAKAAKGVDEPWSLRPRPPILKAASLTHNKLGLGSNRRSEISVFQGLVAADRKYVVGWQNMRGLSPITFDDIARVIRSTITAFEATPPPPTPTPTP